MLRILEVTLAALRGTRRYCSGAPTSAVGQVSAKARLVYWAP
ncbi:hypothetical protein ACFYW6_40155 [Streptomyces sp. NPDC002659]